MKVGVAYTNVHVLRRLKEELAWAINGFGSLAIYRSLENFRLELFRC